MNNTKPIIAIIGGGAAGMMAGAILAESKKCCEIHIFDSNTKLGVKVLISGGGRCNVTTGLNNQHELLKKYTRGAQFLKAALSKCTPKNIFDWFETHGVPLKIENDSRVFPCSDNGEDVVRVFEEIFAQYAVHTHFKTRITNILHQDNQFHIQTSNDIFLADFLIIATGGNAFSKTGSTGDGYHFASTLGHSITKLGPSLNSFLIKETWPKHLSGIALPHAKINSELISVNGPFLFTHFGISGPVTFSLSSHLAFETIDAEHSIIIHLVPCAEINFEQWKKIFQDARKENGKKQIKSLLHTFIPSRLVEHIITSANIHLETTIAGATREQNEQLIDILSNGFKITLIARRPGDEFVTSGGVNTDEINPQTMESLILPKLFFAGEVMNIDGLTGGFNLQSSWATGQCAGKAIIKKYLSGQSPSN